MEKLIELLNEHGEYDLVEHNGEICKWTTDDETGEINIYTDYTNNIISKKFRFIQRLVKNDKIDFDNRELKDKFMEEFERYPTFHNNTYKRDFNINGLLMLLAISDTPIEDLISYLK